MSREQPPMPGRPAEGEAPPTRGRLAGWLADRRARRELARRRDELDALYDAATMRVSVLSDGLVDRIERLREAKHGHEKRVFELRAERLPDDHPELLAAAAASVELAGQMDVLRADLAPLQSETERLEAARRDSLAALDAGDGGHEAVFAAARETVEASRRRLSERRTEGS